MTKTFAPDPDLARLIDAWPILAAPIKAAILALVGSASTEDLSSSFDRAFDRLDREAGSHNFVSLVELRKALACDRQAFDTQLHKLRLARRYSLSAAEGRHGVSREEQEAGIVEEGTLLLYASRR